MKTTIAFCMFLHCSSTLASEWVRQFGTVEAEVGFGVSADGIGNVYVTGYTEGSLDGLNAGASDAFLSKYDANGTLQWTRQFGTSNGEESRDVSADTLGNVYISGSTGGSLEGTNAGERDAFIRKYDANGMLEWTRQLGTSDIDESYGVSADGLGGVYISGYTFGSLEGTNAGRADAFLSKYDSNGAHQWTQQFGTSLFDWNTEASADGIGNVYVSGSSGNSNGLSFTADAYLSKYDANGTHQWTRQIATSQDDRGTGVSADASGNVYITGYTWGSLEGISAGDYDAFLSKYDANGTLEWIRQLGTSGVDESLGVSADRLGGVYITGASDGSLGGPIARRIAHPDAFVAKYSASGMLEWIRQLGTNYDNESLHVSADGLGSVYITGYTEATLGVPNADREDVFVAKFTTDLPELGVDFNGDGRVDGDDVDTLVARIVAPIYDSFFDLSGDGRLNRPDLTQWLSDAATINGFTAPYLLGDTNLDGTVNAADLNNLGQNWLGSPNTWQSGDFNADGVVDANDLNQLALNWRTSIGFAALPESVPELSGKALLYVGAFLAALQGLQKRGD